MTALFYASSFKVGDRVQGPIYSIGRVTKIEGGTVHVTYHERGGDCFSSYSPEWFARYGEFLKRVEHSA